MVHGTAPSVPEEQKTYVVSGLLLSIVRLTEYSIPALRTAMENAERCEEAEELET